MKKKFVNSDYVGYEKIMALGKAMKELGLKAICLPVNELEVICSSDQEINKMKEIAKEYGVKMITGRSAHGQNVDANFALGINLSTRILEED